MQIIVLICDSHSLFNWALSFFFIQWQQSISGSLSLISFFLIIFCTFSSHTSQVSYCSSSVPTIARWTILQSVRSYRSAHISTDLHILAISWQLLHFSFMDNHLAKLSFLFTIVQYVKNVIQTFQFICFSMNQTWVILLWYV